MSDMQKAVDLVFEGVKGYVDARLTKHANEERTALAATQSANARELEAARDRIAVLEKQYEDIARRFTQLQFELKRELPGFRVLP